jgi:hypothetical protein
LSQYTIKRLMDHPTGGDVTAGYIQHPVESLREPNGDGRELRAAVGWNANQRYDRS